jgi:hypothetical protein
MANNLIISWSTEHPVGIFLTAKQYNAGIWLLDTQTSKSKKFCHNFEEEFKSGMDIYRTTIKNDPDESLIGFLEELNDEIPDDEYDEIILNLAGGTKIHNIALWQYFLQKSLGSMQGITRYKVVFVNLQKVEITEWNFENNELTELKKSINYKISFNEYLKCHGYYFTTYNNSNMAGKKLKLRSFEEKENFGKLFEHNVSAVCLDALKSFFKKRPDVEAYVGIKIESRSDGLIGAEYDLLLFCPSFKLVLFEMKSGKNVTLKDLESQKVLARKWGGAFGTFIGVLGLFDATEMMTTNEKDSRIGLIRSMRRHEEKGMKIFTYPIAINKHSNIPESLANYIEQKM